MTGMHDRDHALTQTHLAAKPAVIWHVGQHADIDALIDNRIDDRCPVAHFDADLDICVEPMECGDQCHSGHGIAKPDTQFAALQGILVAEHRERLSLKAMQLRGHRDELPTQPGRQ
jgi:hypothetical protein